MVKTIERTAREVFMPLTVGGGIGSIEVCGRYSWPEPTRPA